MLGMKPILPPCNSTTFTQFSPYLITSTALIPNKPHKTNSNAYSNVPFLQGRNAVFVSAATKQKKGLMDFDDFDELYDEDEDEEEEGVFIPLSGMAEWFEKKPSGFGEGKEYDTSLEDKLLEELEQSRKAQLANINNLKNNPSLISSKEQRVTKVEPVPSGLRVRVGNLPKKKNILRDLQLVFKGFPAIVNISPAVSGSKKTRDPICKGFAFVDLGSMEAANRLVQTYSKKCITFGKIQKQITCEIVNPTKSSDPASKHLGHKYMSTPGQRLPRMEEDSSADSDVDGFSLESREVTPSGESGVQSRQFLSAMDTLKEGIAHMEDDSSADSDVDGFSLESREVTPSGESGVQSLFLSATDTLEEGTAHTNLSETNENENMRPATADKTDSSPLKQQQKRQNLSETIDNENMRPTTTNKTDSSPLKQQRKKQPLKKNQTVKGKSDKSPKLIIPGSSKRLRVKEKAVLLDVFSKYGSKSSLALTKER